MWEKKTTETDNRLDNAGEERTRKGKAGGRLFQFGVWCRGTDSTISNPIQPIVLRFKTQVTFSSIPMKDRGN